MENIENIFFYSEFAQDRYKSWVLVPHIPASLLYSPLPLPESPDRAEIGCLPTHFHVTLLSGKEMPHSLPTLCTKASLMPSLKRGATIHLQSR